MSVVAGSIGRMARKLRRIGDPVVASMPPGVRIRTRIRVTDEEAAELYRFTQHLYICTSYPNLSRLIDRVTTHIESVRPELMEPRR